MSEHFPRPGATSLRRRALFPLAAELLAIGCAPIPAAAPVLAAPPAAQSCREFDTPVMIEGVEQRARGTACLHPDGSWRIEQQVAGQPAQTYVLAPQAYAPYYPPSYLTDPWFYGPPLFLGGVFIGGGWGLVHVHDGWRGAWHAGHLAGPFPDRFAGPFSGHFGAHFRR